MVKTLVSKYKFGFIGIAFGFMGIFMALFQDDLRALMNPKPEMSIVEKSMEKTKSFINDKILNKVEVDGLVVEKSPNDLVSITYYFLGFMALVFSAFSFISKENLRLSAVALSSGLVALAWHYVLYAVGVAVLLLLLSSLGA